MHPEAANSVRRPPAACRPHRWLLWQARSGIVVETRARFIFEPPVMLKAGSLFAFDPICRRFADGCNAARLSNKCASAGL